MFIKNKVISFFFFFGFCCLTTFAQDEFTGIDQLQHIRAITYEKGNDFKHWVSVFHFDDDNILWISSNHLLYYLPLMAPS